MGDTIVELTTYAVDNGINWTSDLIGNTGALSSAETMTEAKALIAADPNIVVKVSEDNNYYGTEDTVAWWEDYITSNEAADKAACDLAVGLGYDEESMFRDELSDACGGDFEDHAEVKMVVIERWRHKEGQK